VLLEGIGPVLWRHVDPVARDDAAVAHRVLVGMPQRDEPRLAVVRRRREGGRPAHGLLRLADGDGQVRAEDVELGARRHAREAADADAHRVDRPSAEQRHDPVAELLDAQAALDDLAVIGGELDRARVAEEVGGVEQVDVERVALDPLPAVEEAAQDADRRIDLDPEEPLEGMYRRHLVGDRTDAADARHDVDHLVGVAPDHQPLEVARRLEDLEVRFRDGAVPDGELEPSLALDAGQLADRVAGDIGRVAVGCLQAVMHPRPPRGAAARRARRELPAPGTVAPSR
jgi:hypothetical protein